MQVETTAAVKYRPLIMSAESVRAILAGTKTVTRRVVKPQPDENWAPHSYGDVHKMHNGGFSLDKHDMPIVTGWGPSNVDGDAAYRCPYGRPGDRLWVREVFAPWQRPNGERGSYYRAHENESVARHVSRWRSPIHMPRWASRLTLELAAVRVERVQDISPSDCWAEGVRVDRTCGGSESPQMFPEVFRSDFSRHWDALNAARRPSHIRRRRRKGKPIDRYESRHSPAVADYSWTSNPWVWVLGFRVVPQVEVPRG